MALKAPVQTTTIDELPLITGEELLAVGDIGPCELREGRVVYMTPTGDQHGSCESNFDVALRTYARQHNSGRVRVGEVGIYTRRDPDSVRGADVAYISNERYATFQGSGFLDVAPDLVVEILSPYDAWSDLMQKLREYFGIGVRMVWVADPKSCTVQAFRSVTDVREFGPGDTLPGDDVLPGFAVAVDTLFED